jgi:GH24 family phage-related lysozyme (muramidase)
LVFTLVLELGKRNVKASNVCIQLLKHHEGVRYKPYTCPASLWTVGVGHLIGDGKSLPREWNKTFTQDEIDGLLKSDLRRFELGISKMLPNVPLRQHEFDAILSFCFNLGLGCFQRSTIRQALLRGDKEQAMESLVKYCRAGGKILKGLQNRRLDERKLFLGV